MHGKRSPKCVIKISVHEIYIQCPKSLIRSKLWQNGTLAIVLTTGDILKEVPQDEIGEKEFDMDLAQRAKTTLWSKSNAGLLHCSNIYDSVVKSIPHTTD